ncbi:MAG: hypothetical protein AAGC81_05700 [Pseudomonadota bacterium]
MRWVLAACIFLLPSVASAKDRLLFIGNSYTAQWSVAERVVELLGRSKVEAVDLSRYNVTLDWHLKEGGALGQIKRGSWSAVILQDFSDTALRPEKAAISKRAIAQLAEASKAIGAKLVFFANWTPASVEPSDIPSRQRDITSFYQNAAKRHDGAVAPVGLAWTKATDLVLRDADRHHANARGGYLAALTIAMTLAPELGMPGLEKPQGANASFDSIDHELLWMAARHALREIR